jgi:hypothetical protein
MTIPHYLGAVRVGEQQLAEAFKQVSERHSREFEISKECFKFSEWSTGHIETLQPPIKQYGMEENLTLEQLRGSLFHGSRVGSLGLLHDLQDLNVMANALRTNYTILHQGVVSLKDEPFEKVVDDLGEQVNKEINWLCTQIKLKSPQVLTVPPNLPQEAVASRPKTVSPAVMPDQIWSPLMGALLTLVVGALSVIFGRVWLFPSLGPTIYLQTEKPADPSARFYNVVLGHLLGLAAGFAAVFLLGAYNDPVPLVDKQITWARVGAAVVALGLTSLLTLLLRAQHPPAGATTLLTALGSIKTTQDAINLTIGVLIVSTIGELIRKMRTSSLTHQITVEPKVPSKAGKI